jgi:uncharacterized RDD family membrane protein YckC
MPLVGLFVRHHAVHFLHFTECSLLIDSRYTIQTPEGVELPVQVAGPPARALAWVVDAFVVVVLYVIISFVIRLMSPSVETEVVSGGVATGLMLVLLFILNWSYDIVCEVWLGGTPGKRALGLQVMHVNGTPVGLRASFIRNVLRTADLFPLFYGLGLAVMCLSDRFQRVGDVLAGTVVVYKDNHLLGVPMMSVASIPVPSHLTYSDRQTILLFAERHPTLAPQRSAELAQRLAFLVPDEQQSNPVPVLLGYANWLIRG